ncbi:terminase [Nocardia cyriacigeorgica]|uniref:terminase n=1 Tax=Nocardia cyriacigeorgica TaxID=135487 RepID=UPI001589C3AE|nr:terminase [Nocardia cyriacigeorgica]
MASTDGFVVDFPTLGDIGEAWVKRHCCIPDGFRRGAEFEWSDWQFWCGANYYRVRPDAQWESDDQPLFNQAFTYRRAQIVAPQKTGKGPWSASATCLEAVGPSQFLGWAGKGDGWACSDWGCGCGWEYEYLQGEPMAMRHPSPVIQLTANNEEQVGNVYRPLTAMIKLGPLSEMMAVREGFIRILGSVGGEDFDRIDAVTSSARGRVGNPVSWVLQDESGLYTQANKMVGIAETQRRGAAGMGGRTMETTNAWDPSENSTAQRTYQSQAEDIFKFFRIPPAGLSWGNKRDRRKILRYVYDGSPWVNLDSIEAEAVELNELDPAQAERFFGNRLVARAGTWLPDGLWESRYAEALAS